MLVAVDGAGVRRTASSDACAFCPACGSALVVRQPVRRVAHFAHRAGEKCDPALLRAVRKRARRLSKAREATEELGQAVLFDLPDDLPVAGVEADVEVDAEVGVVVGAEAAEELRQI